MKRISYIFRLRNDRAIQISITIASCSLIRYFQVTTYKLTGLVVIVKFLPLMIKCPCCVFKCKRHPAIFTVQYLCRRKKSPDLFIALKISLQNFHDYFFINVSLKCLQIWLFFSLLKIQVSILLIQLLMKFYIIMNQLLFIKL